MAHHHIGKDHKIAFPRILLGLRIFHDLAALENGGCAAGNGGGGKRAGGRPGKEPVGTVERYRQQHDDGSITWGYENEDGSYKVTS